SDLSHTSFWAEPPSPEAARFWCGRWDSLPRATRQTIERHILQGPDLDWMEPKADKRRAANWARYRELVRITTAGGALSTRARAELAKLSEELGKPPSQVSVVEGLRQEMWTGWGRQGDMSLVAQVEPDRLLERVAEIEAGDPINQGGLWTAIC